MDERDGTKIVSNVSNITIFVVDNITIFVVEIISCTGKLLIYCKAIYFRGYNISRFVKNLL